jgi:TolA-binding protein
MPQQRPHGWLLSAGLASLLATTGAFFGTAPLVSSARAQDLPAIGRSVTQLEADARNLTNMPVQRASLRGANYVEERLTDGELFYRLHDYTRSSIIFTDIVESHPTHPAFPDALFLLGDSLFRAGDVLGARTRFRQIIDHADETPFRPYVQRALGRLIEIAISTRNFEGVEELFARLSRLPPSEIEAATQYFRAKYLYNRAVPTDELMRDTAGSTAVPQVDQASLDAAREAFEAVQERSPYYLQARYFVGVIFTLKGQYPQAIDAFRRVLRGSATTPEQEEIVALTQVALGRLYYETDRLDEAVEAYQRVPRTSPHFDVALYEIAWVHIRQGDSTQAERALEVLTVAAPESRFIPDGKILRGNLLLRNGRFDDANTVFREVAAQFGPVRQELDAMIASHDDPRAYFRDLVRNNMDNFDANAFLPPLATRWARTEGDMDRALTVLSDLSSCRVLVRDTTALIDRLNAVLGSSNRISAFADLREQRQISIGLRNRLSRTRRQLIAIESAGTATGELAQVRSERRRVEELLGNLPTSDEDFSARSDRLLNRYRDLDRDARNLEVELMGMEARITATTRYMADTATTNTDAAGAAALANELAVQQAAVVAYREQIAQIHLMIERARLQVGVGDERYVRDERTREDYTRLVERERTLIRASGGGARLAESDAIFAKIQRIEQQLDTKDRLLDEVVAERTAEIQRVIDEETLKVSGYRTQLAALEGETVEVVGEITYANFSQVRQRFYDLVLRADVGRIDIAWAEREEHRMRIEMLTRERTRDMQALDDEFREIMDDGASSEAPADTAAGGGE